MKKTALLTLLLLNAGAAHGSRHGQLGAVVRHHRHIPPERQHHHRNVYRSVQLG
jgi:hypothetical protein